MKRELKFRVWDYQKNRWASNSEVIECMGLSFGVEDYFINIAGEKALRYSFCQYTGLRDSNGKDIYEGDVLKAESGKIGEVLFSHGSFRWSNDGDVICKDEYGTTIDVFQIIGNRFSNPELLNPIPPTC